MLEISVLWKISYKKKTFFVTKSKEMIMENVNLSEIVLANFLSSRYNVDVKIRLQACIT